MTDDAGRLLCDRCGCPCDPREVVAVTATICAECAVDLAAAEELHGRELAWKEAIVREALK